MPTQPRQRLATTTSLAILTLPSAARADDSCKWARDGVCDQPPDCAPGTDTSDCEAVQAQLALPHDPVDAETILSGLGDMAGLALLVLVFAAFVWFKRLAGPRTGFTAAALLVLSLGMLFNDLLPWAILKPVLMLTSSLGMTPTSLLLVVAVVIAIYGLAARGTPQAGSGSTDGGPRAALSPDVQEADFGEISAARRTCQVVAEQLEAALKEAGGRFHLYAHYDAASAPWLSVDRLASDTRGAFLSTLRMDFVPQPFCKFPVAVNLQIDDRGRRRRVTSITTIGPTQLNSLVKCLMGEGPRFVWKGERLRELGWLQPWRPKQESNVLEGDFLASLRANFKLIGAIIVLFPIFAAWQAQPALVTVALVVSVWAWFRFYVPRPAYRVTGACPPRPPRLLRQLDSWQVVVRDLGPQREATLDRLEKTLDDRLGSSEEPVVVRRENIWYPGVDGKVERQQLTLSLRRAIVFVRIYQYGTDLFVGWDAHVNLLCWKERVVHSGHRESDGLKVNLIGISTDQQAINEYDLTDANFLLEAVHAHLTSLLKDVLREREIDQEIDFAIVRESRQAVMGSKSEKGHRRFFQRT